MASTSDDVLGRLETSIRDRLDDTWTAASVEWYDIGGFRAPRILHCTGPGSARDEPLTDHEVALLGELLESLAGPAGAPISVELFFDRHEPGVGLDCNRDRRIVVDARGGALDDPSTPGSRPTDEEWRREFDRHPRRGSDLPAWWNALLIGTDRSTDGVESVAIDVDAMIAAAEARADFTPRFAAVARQKVSSKTRRRLIAWIMDLARGLDAERLAALAAPGSSAHRSVSEQLAAEAAPRAATAGVMCTAAQVVDYIAAVASAAGVTLDVPAPSPDIAAKPLVSVSGPEAELIGVRLEEALRLAALDLIGAAFGAA